MRALSVAASLVLVLLVGACAPAVQPSAIPSVSRPDGFPEDFYLKAHARGEAVYRIEPEDSRIIIRVGRGGSLARLGHDHIVASRDVRGYVLWSPNFEVARSDIYMSLETLSVDEPALRAQAGLDTQPSQSDIEGTRRNMAKALRSDVYPFVTLRLMPNKGELPRLVLRADITLHGVTRTFFVPAETDISGSFFQTSGKFSINQTDFDVKPYSVLGGALQVQDRLDIEFSLRGARRLP